MSLIRLHATSIGFPDEGHETTPPVGEKTIDVYVAPHRITDIIQGVADSVVITDGLVYSVTEKASDIAKQIEEGLYPF